MVCSSVNLIWSAWDLWAWSAARCPFQVKVESWFWHVGHFDGYWPNSLIFMSLSSYYVDFSRFQWMKDHWSSRRPFMSGRYTPIHAHKGMKHRHFLIYIYNVFKYIRRFRVITNDSFLRENVLKGSPLLIIIIVVCYEKLITKIPILGHWKLFGWGSFLFLFHFWNVTLQLLVRIESSTHMNVISMFNHRAMFKWVRDFDFSLMGEHSL